MKPLDMTGKRYGKLVAIALSNNRSKSRKAKWLFRCDCGNTKEIDGGAVRLGNSRSCGCGIIEATARRN